MPGSGEGRCVVRAIDLRIGRHIEVQSAATLYDLASEDYFEERRVLRRNARQRIGLASAAASHPTFSAIMRTNYVLIDYENVQPDSLKGLDEEHFKVLLFVGASQTKLTFEVAEAMQRLGPRAQYVKITGNGPNALDFHIAFYIGHTSAGDDQAYFHIISKDTGFDPLIEHLKGKKIAVVRSKSVEDIPLLKAANSKSLPEKVAVVVADLKRRGASRPRTIKTLSSTVSSLFQKQLPEAELNELINELRDRGYVKIHEKKVSYALP